MIKSIKSISKKLFSSKSKQAAPPVQEKLIPVVVTSYSQPHVLQYRMSEEKLNHGDRVKATLSPVRLESVLDKMVMYFCPLTDLEVSKRIERGDGGALPSSVTIHNTSVPENLKPGLYVMENAELYSNGTLQVIANKDTAFVPFKYEIPF